MIHTPRKCRWDIPPKRRYLPASSQADRPTKMKTNIGIVSAMGKSDLKKFETINETVQEDYVKTLALKRTENKPVPLT
jgi:hypothetical protein